MVATAQADFQRDEAPENHPLFGVLDTVENICPERAQKSYFPGHFSQQYLGASRAGLWGQFGGTCGAAVLTKSTPETVKLAPVLCDQWACDLCGPRKAAWLKRELSRAQAEHGLDYFWTLTVDTRTCTARDSTRLITRWWHIMHRRLIREHGRFPYLWILEHTKRGYAHLHLLTACSATRPAIRRQWRQVARGSYVVDVAPVASDRAGDYIAKYCTQQARQRGEADYAHLRGRRLYSTSRDVQFAPFRPPGEREVFTDEETGERLEHSPWRRWDKPYWVARDSMTVTYGAPAVQRVHGAPFAEFIRSGPGTVGI